MHHAHRATARLQHLKLQEHMDILRWLARCGLDRLRWRKAEPTTTPTPNATAPVRPAASRTRLPAAPPPRHRRG